MGGIEQGLAARRVAGPPFGLPERDQQVAARRLGATGRPVEVESPSIPVRRLIVGEMGGGPVPARVA